MLLCERVGPSGILYTFSLARRTRDKHDELSISVTFHCNEGLKIDELRQLCFHPFFLDESERVEVTYFWNGRCQNSSYFIW
jgi:hypothetical protein